MKDVGGVWVACDSVCQQEPDNHVKVAAKTHTPPTQQTERKRLNNGRKDIAVAVCPECRAVFYDGYNAELRCRWVHVDHLPGCRYRCVIRRVPELAAVLCAAADEVDALR
jgi:hypothetical protein